jgi:NAD/NADP transhydrogenase beta subunit
MTLSAWYTPILIGIDVLVVIYGLRVAVTENKIYGWFLALAFFLFGVKEVLPYNGITLPSTVALILSVAGLAFALCAFYLLARSLPS